MIDFNDLPTSIHLNNFMTVGPTVTMFLEQKLNVWLSGDISVKIGQNTLLVDVSSLGRANLLTLRDQFNKGANTVDWYQSTGSVVLTESQLTTIENAVSDYISKVMKVWQTASDGIKDKTIKELIEIENLEWPSRTY